MVDFELGLWLTLSSGHLCAFRGWVRVLGYGFGVRGRKVKSRDCALASDLVRACIRAVAVACLSLLFHSA